MCFRELCIQYKSLQRESQKNPQKHPLSENWHVMPDIIKTTTSQVTIAPVSEVSIFSFNSSFSKAGRTIGGEVKN